MRFDQRGTPRSNDPARVRRRRQTLAEFVAHYIATEITAAERRADRSSATAACRRSRSPAAGPRRGTSIHLFLEKRASAGRIGRRRVQRAVGTHALTAQSRTTFCENRSSRSLSDRRSSIVNRGDKSGPAFHLGRLWTEAGRVLSRAFAPWLPLPIVRRQLVLNRLPWHRHRSRAESTPSCVSPIFAVLSCRRPAGQTNHPPKSHW